MTNLLVPPHFQFVDPNGRPYSGGALWTYIPGTFTAKTTWQDPDGDILNSNPVELGIDGTCTVFGAGSYRLVLKDADGVQVFDQVASEPLDSTAISPVMRPVTAAASLAQARLLMGVTGAIQSAVSGISLMTGPTGPSGPTGPVGVTGPTGPAGPDIRTTWSTANPGYVLFGPYGSSPILQFGEASTDSSGMATITFAKPFTAGVLSLGGIAASGTVGGWWINVNSYGNSTVTFTSSSPYRGGMWVGGPIPFFWYAIGE